uniref:Uncharacterized protein n=1 Tax=Clastoptera arizonana TaxID=38151 RepID=A0A1B6CTD2_9HEMI
MLGVDLAGCTTGSCLSYGHSCWGAHGKRSSEAQDSRWFISRLAPISSRLQHQSNSGQWFARPAQETEEDQRKPPLGEQSLLIPDEVFPAEETAGDREVIVMEQRPRIFKLLNRSPNKIEFKDPVKK